jgi:HAD superfamily hydrolase (TIGR01490 family)
VPDNSLAIFDLDGTITRHDSLWPYIWGYLRRHPERWWRLAACLFPLARYACGSRDLGRLKGAILHWTLGGVRRSTLDAWSAEFTVRLLRDGLYAEALSCIAALRHESVYLVLLSASTDLYVPQIARALGFDECACTEVRWHGDGTLDGRLASVNRRGPEKARYVRSLLAERQPRFSEAFGDNVADLEHLQLVSRGTYVNGSAQALTGLPTVQAVVWRTPGHAVPVAPVE